ncbi:MAG: adenylate/guanylate cyclase domain-containing protein [Actinomycetota bacterium]
MVSEAEFEAAGLFDPAINAGTGRLELLHWLAAKGFTIPEMVAALEWPGLGGLAGDRRIVTGERLSDERAREISGLGPEHFTALVAALGFVPWAGSTDGELGLTATEAETLSLFGPLSTLFTDDETLDFIRVVSSALARMAEAAVSLFLIDVEMPHLASRGDELELAEKVYDAVGLLDELIPMLDPLLRRQVLHATERSRYSTINALERLQHRYAVGFVDLVGFTPLSQAMSPAELRFFISDFERRAHDAVAASGARLVKLIGDEVMFVSHDPDAAGAVAQALMTNFAVGDGSDVAPRGGLAYGEVLVRGGDYYGAVVNLASRLADAAAPRELLVTEPFAEASSTLDFAPAGRRMLKGFADPVAARSAYFGDG